MKTTPCSMLPIAVLTLFLAACASSPGYQYYLLTAQSTPATESDDIAVGIGPVSIPEYLARNEIIYRRDGNRVRLAGTARWAEPLVDGMQRVLALNLAAQLGTQNVGYLPGLNSAPPGYAVKVNVLALDVTASQAQLTAEWIITQPAEEAPVARSTAHERYSMPEGEPTPATVAGAYSELLGQLSAGIAAQIAAHAGAQDGAAPH